MDEVMDVSEYGRMSVGEALDLPIDYFLLIRRQGYMRQMQSTEEGRKYLKDCERYKVTEPDIEGLKKLENKLGRR